MKTQTCRRSWFFGRAKALGRARRPRHSHAHATCQRLSAVVVEANERNEWGDVSGSDEDAGNGPISETNLSFDVMGSVGKVLTAKALQHVLAQLGETDLIVCQWLNNFAAEVSPLRGDAFIVELMQQIPSSIVNPSSGKKHHVNPQQLGNRVILMRAELSKSVGQMVPGDIQKRNMSILRKHLEATSYISGSSEGKGQSGYRRGGEGNSRSRFH